MSESDAPPVQRLRLRRYRAVDEPGSCERYYRCHLEILQQFDMTGITSLDREWFTNPEVHAMVIESQEDGELLGGVRLHKADGRHALPTERAISFGPPLGPEVGDFVRDRLAEGIGESCALWVSRRFAKMGVLPILMAASLSIAEPLGVRSLLGSCGLYTLRPFQELGYVVETRFGDAGTFIYPSPDRNAFFIALRDTHTFADATSERRDLILDLRRRPRQSRRLESPQAVLDVDIDLRLPGTALEPENA